MNLKSLYHYTKFDSAKKIISSEKIKLSIYPKINDPFDMAKDIIYHPEENIEILYDALSSEKEIKSSRHGISSIFNPDKKTAISRLEEVVKENLENWSLKNTIANTPFFCLSDDFNIPLMWGHYGDGYKGVVLEFGGDLIKKAEKVHYAKFDILPSVINSERFIKAIFKNDPEETKRFVTDLLIKKHRIWSYEQEYRIIFNPNIKTDKDSNRFCNFYLKDLKGVYFGFKAEENDIVQLIQNLKAQNLTHIKFYRMIRKPGYFDAKPQEIVYF